MTRSSPRFPVSPAAMVPRRGLVARLDAAADAKVITVAAPGGSGKSTLLLQWLDGSARRVVWLTVPTGSDTLSVADRIAAELSAGSASAKVPLPIVHEEALWFSVVLPALAAVVSGQPEPFVLVLDDAMNVSDRQTDSLIETLVMSLPEESQLVLATRGAPPHAVRRLRPSGRTLELGVPDLAMSSDEARALLDELSVHLPEDQLAHAVERTEGWPVGIYLLGLAVLSDPDLLVTDGVPALTPEWISDYIRDEIFDELDPEDARFLMQVSVLEELTGPTCDAVAGTSGSLVRLRELSAEYQLIMRTSGGEESYRIHQLLNDFLRSELRGRSIADFERSHGRAARWFADDGQDDLAVSHLRDAGDDAALGDFVWSHAWRLLSSGQMPVMRRWIDGIDQDRLASHPGLCLTAAWIGTHEGDMAKVLRYADVARSLVQGAEPQSPYPSHVAITDSVIGADGLLSVIASTTAAIEARGDTDPWTSLALFLRGVAQIHYDRVDEGLADLLEGHRIAEIYEVTHMRAHLLAAQAVVRLAQGDKEAAGALITRARAVVIDNHLESIPTGAPIFTASALVMLATGRRAEAAGESVLALRLTALIESIAPWHAVEGRLRLAQVYRQLGDRERARVLTTEARDRYTPAAHSPLLDVMLAEAEAQLQQSTEGAPLPSLLTTAELRVMQYLPSHLTFPEIGQQLWLSRHTVKSQALSAYRKLGVSSRSAAVARARELGLVPPR